MKPLTEAQIVNLSTRELQHIAIGAGRARTRREREWAAKELARRSAKP